jgi:hypothetical protein
LCSADAVAPAKHANAMMNIVVALMVL